MEKSHTSPPGKLNPRNGGYGGHCRSVKSCLLHISKLEGFKSWLKGQEIPYRDGKGEYQVIQVKTPKFGWQVVYLRNKATEHYSINAKLVSTVERFLRSQS